MSTMIKSNFKRYEKKFFLSPEQYKLFVQKINEYVIPDEHPNYTICNIYYDTDDFRLIRASIEKPIYKEKLRLRSYGVPDADSKLFLELKKKYDGVVYKRRITTVNSKVNEILEGNDPFTKGNQITKEIEYFQSFYKTSPKVFLAYDRQAFKGKENEELRITFDTNMRYRLSDVDLFSGDKGEKLIEGDDILMEIKIPGACPLWLTHILSELKINSVSFSKYGTCYREHILKDNKEIYKKEMLLSA